MLNFQEQAANDLSAVFFNATAKEFVTTHKIAGIRGGKASPPVECQVVVDHDLYIERKIKDKVENITLDGFVFFIKKSDWPEGFNFPTVNAELQFDGKRYLISSVMENMGALEITLESNRG